MRQAGARQVAVVSRHRWALVCELEPDPEPPFEAILGQFDGFDLVLVEGYKQLLFPKIEARSQFQQTRQRLADDRDDIVAIASDNPEDAGTLPRFHPDDMDAIAAFIIDLLRLRRGA